MNLLHDIFLENFEKRYYYTQKGRAYVEYVQSLGEKFSGKICFFHFSHEIPKLNSLYNYEIVKFIKLYYSYAYEELIHMMKHAIQEKFVMTMNSLDEYKFVIKFWNYDKNIRALFQNIIQKYCCVDFVIDNDESIRFFELEIDLREKFKIRKVIIYKEKKLVSKLQEKTGYIDKDNIFMTLEISRYDYTKNGNLEKGVLIKLREPICFIRSNYIMENIFSSLEVPFRSEDLYLAFVEQFPGEENIFYTHKYSIPA